MFEMKKLSRLKKLDENAPDARKCRRRWRCAHRRIVAAKAVAPKYNTKNFWCPP